MKEVRNLEQAQAEVRALKDSRTIEGYAIVFNSESRDLGGFREIVKPEAVKGVLEKADVLALLNHDQSRGLLARSTKGEGTLQLSVDDKGVRYKFEAPQTSIGEETLDGIQRGDIRTSSFSFVVAEGGQEWRKQDDGIFIRTITGFADIMDVSPVYKEAYPDTTAASRALDELKSNEIPEQETAEDEEKRAAQAAEKFKLEMRKALNQSKSITMKEFKDMTALELTDKNAELRDANEAIYSAAGEKALDAEQRKEVEGNLSKITEIRGHLNSIGNAETRKMKVGNNKKEATEKRFNLMSAIKNRAEGRAFSPEEKQVIDAGVKEMRKSGVNPEGDIILGTEGSIEARADITAGTATQGKEIVPTEKSNILAPLRDSLVMAAAGATFLTGLTGNFSIPAYAGTTAAWKGEVADADDGGGAFSDVDFAPLRLTAYVDISKLFLNQDSVSAESMLKQDIVDAVAEKLETTLLSEAAASAGVSPAGLFAGGDPSINGAATWANVVAQETALGTNKALKGNLSYIMAPAAKGIYKTTKKDAGSGIYLMGENNVMNGYNVHVTNAVQSGLQTGADEYGVLFANWQDFVIAQWGGVDLTIDPYTLAKSGQVRIVINAYFDAKFRRTASLSTASVK